MVWQETPMPPGMRLDAEQERELRLISQARAGADWALAALVARYQPMVIRYLTRLVGDAERARDLAEGVFLRMERRLRGPHGGDYLRLWLLRACTEAGLESLRRPRRGAAAPRLDVASSPARLLSERVGSSAQRLRSGFGKLAERTSATSRQVRQMIWADDGPDTANEPAFGAAAPVTSAPLPEDSLDPRAALRHQMVRAVLAEIPYGDAQCVALHLVAGLNQAEVAQALGIRASAARRHIVLGLEVFSQRYESALAQIGIPPELAYADLESSGSIPAPRPQAPAQTPAPPTNVGYAVTIPNIPTPKAEAEAEAEPEAAASATAPETMPAAAPPASELAEPTMAAEVLSATVAAEPAAAEPAAAEEAASEETMAATAAEATEPTEAITEPSEAAPADAPLPPVIVPVRGDDVRVHTGSEAAAAAEDEPPFRVEPPLWQSPELADGALSPSASLSRQKPSIVTLVADAPTLQNASTREETLAAVAGTLLSPLAPLPAPGLEAAPAKHPIVEMVAIVAAPDPAAQDPDAVPGAPLAYEPVAEAPMPRHSMSAAPVVPVLSSAPAASALPASTAGAPAAAPLIIPLLSSGQAPDPTPTQIEGSAPVGPPLTPATMPTVPKPTVVPVRTPDS